MKPVPLRVPHRPSAVRPVGRILLPEVSCPLNDIPRASPVWSELFQAHPGSALRLTRLATGHLSAVS